MLVPVTGLVSGLAAVLIAHVMAFLQNQFWGSGLNLLDAAAQLPWYFIILIPTFGGLAVGLIGKVFNVETRGAGTAGMVQAVALKGGYVSIRQTTPRVIAGILTLATGGSLGREGPMTQFGGALGSWLGRYFNLTTQQRRVLLCAAGGSAIAAVYNAPIGGSLFALEILMGNFALEVFGPVVVASVISTLVFRSAMGDLPRFVVPQYELVSAWELPVYLLLGIIAGIVSILFVRSLFWAEDGFEKLRVPTWSKPAIGFALTGALAVFLPHVLGNGYDSVNLALHEQLPLTLLLVLPLAKIVATALTLGSGGAGGLFMPSLMIGGLLGGAYGIGANHLLPELTAGPGAYALVGMGAIVAGTTHAPLTAIMMIFEQTNNYQIVLPLMFVCIISNLTVRAFKTQSTHMETLRRRGVILPHGPEESVMKSLHVADVMHEEVETVNHRAPFRKVVEYFLQSSRNYLYVVDDDQNFLGAISLHAMKDMLTAGQGMDMVLAIDLVEPFETVSKTEPLADTMDKFWRQNSERLPVLEGTDSRKLIGWISKRDLLGIYSQEILKKHQLLSRFSMTDEHGEERGVYVELPEGFQIQTLVVPAELAGRTIAEIAPRSTFGVHVLQVSHHDPLTRKANIEIPGPTTVLRAHDRLVVIGPGENINRLQQVLDVDVESPKL